MSTNVVKLSFLSPVHFGEGRLEDSGIACDAATLFSALFMEALHNNCANELLQAVRSGNLLLSDAFPYIGDSFYLPKPAAARKPAEPALAAEDSTVKKAAKKLSYIRSETYQNFLNNTFDAVKELELFKRGIGTSYAQTKVNLLRQDSSDALPYQVGGFRYYEGAGIYFIVQGAYNIEPFLNTLQYSGLGGKRTSGYGRFSYEVINRNPLQEAKAQSEQTTSWVLLSTAAPTQDELIDELLEGASYKMVHKGGFVQSPEHSRSPQKKQDFYLFASGSVFQKTFQGDVFDVNATPNAHSVYRYARALWMEV